jgi:predicted metal-binding membrane protein
LRNVRSVSVQRSGLERLLLRDRAIVIASLLAIIVTSWFYVFSGAGTGMSAWDMSSLWMALGWASQKETMDLSSGMAATMASMATPAVWTLRYAVLMFFMWWVMMLAMMLPSAAPMILLHAMVDRKTRQRQGESGGVLSSAVFSSGYLLAWGLFSLAAVALQWAFELSGILSSSMMNATNTGFAGIILLVAGAWQLTPLKQACLKHCQGPLQYLTQHWRSGTLGTFRMGLQHGAYCLGCCWGLMGILFFGGIMNLYWIIGLAIIVLLEKLLPIGALVSRITGGLLLVWGSVFFYVAFVS